MIIYKVALDAEQRRHRQSAQQILIAVLIAILITAVATMFFSSDPLIRALTWTIAVMLGMLSGLVFAKFRNLPAKQVQYFESAEWILGEDSITQRVGSDSELTIERNQISHILESPEVGLHFMTEEPLTWLHVPARVEGYDNLRAGISDWSTWTVRPRDKVPQNILILPWFAAYTIALVSLVDWLFYISSAILIIITLGAGLFLFFNRHADMQTRRSGLAFPVIIMPILCKLGAYLLFMPQS